MKRMTLFITGVALAIAVIAGSSIANPQPIADPTDQGPVPTSTQMVG